MIIDSSCAAGWLEALLVEHTALCHLVSGSKVAALGAIVRLTHLVREHPALTQVAYYDKYHFCCYNEIPKLI